MDDATGGMAEATRMIGAAEKREKRWELKREDIPFSIPLGFMCTGAACIFDEREMDREKVRAEAE